MNEQKPVDRPLEILRQDVIESMERVSVILDEASTLDIFKEDSPEWQDLRGQADAVRSLELVMPIVAPMKAGKSTLINAIIGYPLLPARASAMTTLSTRITLVDDLDLDKPELDIPERTLALFQRMTEEIQRKLTDSTWPDMESQPHLKKLATSIAGGRADPLRPHYRGTASIQSILIFLNDLLRLAKLANAGDMLDDLTELPQLRTGHWGRYTKDVDTAGELVIVDTPGPNENAMAAELGPALEAQLRQSHVLLVVLDYTQVGSTAEGDVKDRLKRHLAIIGNTNVLAVVNKVDERKKGDPNVEDTRNAVRASLELSKEQAADQIFETVAKYGLTGAQMIIELEHMGDAFDPMHSDAARAVIREKSPLEDEDSWEQLLGESTSASLTRSADQLLKKSHIKELVDNAIVRLRTDAAPTVMKAGVERYLEALRSLGEVIALERAATEHERAAVAKELHTLDAESRELEEHRKAMPDTKTLERRFSNELAQFVRRLNEQGQAIVELLKSPDEPEGAASHEAHPQTHFYDSIFRFTKVRLWDGLFRGKPDIDVQEFPDLSEAEKFTSDMSDSVANQLNELLASAKLELESRVKDIKTQVVVEQEGKVRDLITRSAANLSAAFSVKLKMPPPAVEGGVLAVELAEPTARTKHTRYSYQVTERQRRWRYVPLIKHDVVVTKHGTSASEVYMVSRSAVAEKLLAAFDERLAEIEDGLDGYVATKLTASLRAYYDDLTDFFQKYHETLSRVLDQSKLSEAAKAQRKDAITTLAKEIADEGDRLHGYLGRLKELAVQPAAGKEQ